MLESEVWASLGAIKARMMHISSSKVDTATTKLTKTTSRLWLDAMAKPYGTCRNTVIPAYTLLLLAGFDPQLAIS